jgi:stearoyl-CoA desaturase (delta-9 desaturase)
MLATPRDRYPINWLSSTPFILCQFVPLLAVFTGITAQAVILGVVLYWTRVFFITGGYHRYFSHRSYKLARVPQFLMAFGGITCAQKGPLWWASHHREHHRYSDTDRDPHSPQKGFWWSHVGWIMCDEYGGYNHEIIRDFEKYPEIKWLNDHDWIGPWMLAVASWLIAGWSGLVVGFFGSTVLLWHSTFLVNSLSHISGRRRYVTSDTSRNNPLVAFLTMGEGWHNNHHHYPSCARQGFYWWEFDATYYVLRVLSWLHIVKDLKQPPASVRSTRRLRDDKFDVGRFRARLAAAAAIVPAESAELIALLASTADGAGKRRIGAAAD